MGKVQDGRYSRCCKLDIHAEHAHTPACPFRSPPSLSEFGRTARSMSRPPQRETIAGIRCKRYDRGARGSCSAWSELQGGYSLKNFRGLQSARLVDAPRAVFATVVVRMRDASGARADYLETALGEFGEGREGPRFRMRTKSTKKHMENFVTTHHDRARRYHSSTTRAVSHEFTIRNMHVGRMRVSHWW